MTASGNAEVHFAGIDLSRFVTSFVFDPKGPHAEAMRQRIAGLADSTMTLRGTFNPALVRVVFVGRGHRLRRMHTAYGRRRGRGRW